MWDMNWNTVPRKHLGYFEKDLNNCFFPMGYEYVLVVVFLFLHGLKQSFVRESTALTIVENQLDIMFTTCAISMYIYIGEL